MSKHTGKFISDVDSDILHVIVGESVRHVIRKVITVANDPTIPDISFAGFTFLRCNSRKIRYGEFDFAYEGRLYEFHYMRYLD